MFSFFLCSIISDLSNTCYGYDAQDQRESLHLQCPIEHGVVTDWELMVQIWIHAFKELRARPEDYPIMATEPPLNPIGQSQYMTQVKLV